MFRFPLTVKQDGAVYDANLAAVAITYGPCGGYSKARAQFIVDSLNRPFAAAEAAAKKQAGVCMAANDEKGNEFWIRLAGSLRKAQEKVTP